MSSQGVKTVVLYLEDWQQRMIKDTLGLECNTYTVDVNVPGDPIVRYKVVTPGEEAALKRMYFSDWQIPCVKIADVPRFQWRGLMLDVSRHFYNKQEVEKLLDVMALHKLNTEYLATVASASRQNVSHQVAMIGIEGQRSDPIGTLERQQAVEKAAIQAHYNAQLEEANKTLKDAELILTRRNLAAQKNLELDRLDYELAQKKASDTSSISGNLAAGKRNAESPSEIANGVINSAGDRMADQFRVWRSRASRPGMRP